MKKSITIFALLLAAALTAGAQPFGFRHVADNDSLRLNFHMSVGGAAMSGFGNGQVVSWVAPRVSYKATERLKLHGGFAAAGSLLPGNFELQGHGNQSLAPRRQGTRAGVAWAAAEYRASDKWLLWAYAAKAKGYYQPLWSDRALPLDATVLGGGFTYRFNENSLLAMHFQIVHDNYGTLLYPPCMADPWLNPVAPAYGFYPW